jgi:carotenoid cleavage dioxygenase
MLGFMPWLLFLFLSGHTLASLKIAILVSFVASLTFGFDELRRGYILQWGTLLFFAACAVLLNVFEVLWVATNMAWLANGVLACIMWLTIASGRPFALQYARRDLPKERWNDPGLIAGCRLITLVWACLISFSTLVSLLRQITRPDLPEWLFFSTSLAVIVTGLTFTTLFKRQKRLQREQMEARREAS